MDLSLLINAINNDIMYTVLISLSCLFFPVLLWGIWAGIRVNTVYKKYHQTTSLNRFTGAETARRILDSEGLHDVPVYKCKGSLTDHFDPKSNAVFLSESTYDSVSIGALGVAAHEVGHAIQYAKGYAPMKIRAVLVPILNISSKISMPLLLFSILLEIIMGFNAISNLILTIAVGVYFLSMLFSLITLPVEYNASRRAKKLLLTNGIIYDSESQGVSKVLNAAAQTYVASFVLSLVQLARMLLILLSRRGNRN